MEHLVLILVGEEDVDELSCGCRSARNAGETRLHSPRSTVAETLPTLEAVIGGVVGGALTVDAVAGMHGKVAVALGEVFHLGVPVHSDADTVLKLAKMKPLA